MAFPIYRGILTSGVLLADFIRRNFIEEHRSIYRTCERGSPLFRTYLKFSRKAVSALRIIAVEKGLRVIGSGGSSFAQSIL